MSTNVSSVTKHFPSPQNGFQTTLASTISSGATTVPLNSVAGYTNGQIAVLVVDPTSTTAKQTFTGVVDTSGVQLTSVVWTAGTNQSHAGGVTVVDNATATHIAMMSKGIKVEHNDNGTHAAVTATGLTVTGATTLTGATVMNGSWDGWVGANESWSYASSSTITVPTDATTKYDIGDFVKITQSATVKYFVITSLTSTVLTVAGLSGVTVANSAITANAYSKAKNPHGANSYPGYNPVKFYVYRSAAQTIVNAGLILCDTKVFDTGTNVDVTTNKGRFTAPVAGYYYFIGLISFQINGHNGVAYAAQLNKNGVQVLAGNVDVNMFAGSYTISRGVSGIIQLAVGDYVELYCGAAGGGGGNALATGIAGVYFQGNLVSLA